MSANCGFRLAERSDAGAVAALHADSWQRNYRGAYADAFLDGDVADDRLAVWSERLQCRDARAQTILAEEGARLIGFAHVVLEEDPLWGALLDNIHVAHCCKRRGVGSELLARAAEAGAAGRARRGLYLWVLEQNRDARAFYEARGATRAEAARVSPPGGVPGRLNGAPSKLRYVWSDAGVLVRPR